MSIFLYRKERHTYVPMVRDASKYSADFFQLAGNSDLFQVTIFLGVVEMVAVVLEASSMTNLVVELLS